MVRLAIHTQCEAACEPCGLCGKVMDRAVDPGLYLAEEDAVVCHSCGKKYAPSLAALLDLARVARRVGKLGRHTLVPPLGALLDLARAAEDYSFTVSRTTKQAA